MLAWRGVFIQLFSIMAVVAIVGMSRIADPHIVSMALGIIGAGLGQSIARARLDSGSSNGGNNGTPSGRSIAPVSLISGAVTVLCFFASFGLASWALS